MTTHSDACFDALRPALSPHVAHVLETESPLHAWTYHRLLGGKPKPSTDAQAKGTILHNLFLERGDRVLELPFDSYRTKAAQDARDEGLLGNWLPCLSPKLAEARACVDRWRDQIAQIKVDGKSLDLAAGQAEVPLEWVEDGVLCHGRADWISSARTLVIDLKTTEGNNSPPACAAALVNTAGVIQDHAYRRALELDEIDLAGRVQMLFLFAQTVEPFAVTPIVCGATMREIGMGRWRRSLETWAKCLRTNHWPSYATYPIQVEAPGWMLAREQNEELVG